MPDFSLHPQLEQDCFFIGDLDLCRLLLMNDRNYPWCILVPRRSNKRDLFELNETDQGQFMFESSLVSRTMMNLFQGEKMNVAALGNMVSQLHVHHIVRFKKDACWPRPVWGEVTPIAYVDEEAESRVADIRKLLSVF